MNSRILLSLILFLIYALNTYSKEEIKTTSDSINKCKVLIVSSSIGAALYGSFLYVENSWWSDQQMNFHFDNGADLTYALNVDKLGHFMGGIQAADIFSSSMRWAGMNKRKSLWYGAFFGAGLQLAIEIKDAYAPYWGFSKWDFAIGSLGSFWPASQQYYDNLEAIDFKFSYFKHSDIYWQLDRERGKKINKYAWQDDYPNQTYWATFDVNHFIETCCWPRWLNIAVGFGLDDTQYLDNNYTKTGGNNEWYIALDYDIPKMLKNWNSPTGNKVKKWLNYFHLPAPTIRISPKLEFYPLFL